VAGIVVVMTLDLPETLLVALFGLLIVCCRDDRGWLGWFLALPVPLWLGRISYSLYITHYIFIRLFDAPWERLIPTNLHIEEHWSIAVISAEGIIILGFAYLTYRYVELPARKWILERAKYFHAI
jgi:peptidoglycan/LPS O-acetylase OafA/YrhL